MEEYLITPEKVAEHLAGVVRFPTVSYVDESLVDWDSFFAMHEYLKKAYPLIHKTMELEIVGKAALLYHWKGTGKSQNLPLLFMAHQDVVPEGDHAKWIHPPYGGEIDDGYIYGRGVADCKGVMIAVMEACEHLISTGFTPDYDLYMAFGYNEEIGSGIGEQSAAWKAAHLLEERGIRFGGIFDEGMGISYNPAIGPDTPTLSITLGEKGYADFEIVRTDPGGHSAMPKKEGALWYVAKAIEAIEEHPFPYRVIDGIDKKYKTLAKYIQDPHKKEVFADLAGHWDEVVEMLEKDKMMAAVFHTTMAVTMAHGSAKANILPEEASVTVNCRLLEGDTLESVKAYLESIVPEGMEVRLLTGNEASPTSVFDCEIIDFLQKVCEEKLGKSVAVIPDVSFGGTDAKNMYNISDHVYRFVPLTMSADDRPLNAHSVNETIRVDVIAGASDYYVSILKKYGEQPIKA